MYKRQTLPKEVSMKVSRVFLPVLVILLSLTIFTSVSFAGGTQAGLAAVETATATALPEVTPTPAVSPTPTAIPENLATVHDSGGAESCQMCHGHKQLKGVARNLDPIELSMSPADFQSSVHSKAGLTCTSCHADRSKYPHSDTQQVTCTECHGNDVSTINIDNLQPVQVILPYDSKRDMMIALNDACRTCHEQQFAVATDSAHMKVLQSGNLEAPLCIDCHGSHNIQPPAEPRSKIAKTCATCHEAVYSSYKSSVHGMALLEGNVDVPTCVDCHGVHSVSGPRDTNFRNDSIVMCGNCHGNKELMKKYNISADVFNTYVDDFHGRTVNLYRQQDRGVSSTKAVCFDCHGIHNIRKPSDPLSSVNPANLMKTCQQCHPDANKRFTDAWLGHYTPDAKNMPVLFGVNLFYQLVIPGTLGFFAVYIALDARKRWAEKRDLVMKALEEEEDEDDSTH
jgi:hypothetical protein